MSTSTSCVPFFTNTVIGTPQARCREITQSGLASIMPVMRFSPEVGTHWVSRIDLSGPLPQRLETAIARRAASPQGSCRLPRNEIGLSMWMNHCGVLRKITGFFERHECGYWCLRRARAMIMLRARPAP